jgi:hypothetical protein
MQIKRLVRRLVVGIVVSLVLYTLFLTIQREVHRHRGNRELEAAFAETDTSDPNWRWEQLNAARPQVPDDQNSALLIPKIKTALPAENHPLWRDLNEPELPSNFRLPDSVLQPAQRFLAASPEAVLLARTLKDRPRGFRVIELHEDPLMTPLHDTQDTRVVARILHWNIRVSVENREYTHAADDLLSLLNASRSIGDEPFLVSQLIRIAIRASLAHSLECAIAQTQNPADLAALRLPALQEALAQDVDEPLLLYALRGERAMFDTLFQRLGDGTIDIETLRGPNKDGRSTSTRIGWWIYGGRHPKDRAFCLRWFNTAVEMAQKPLHEQPADFEGLAPLVQSEVAEKNVLARLLPAAQRVAAAYWRSVGQTRCAVAGIACERFRLKHGRWPATLAELCPEFLPTVPLDPFDGQPLKYAKQPDGIVVHTVAPKQPTFGAETEAHLQQLGVRRNASRPGLPEGIELGFRLWNPDQRRLPPPPDPPPPKDEDKP